MHGFLKDNGTCFAVRQYVSRAGKQANSEELTVVIGPGR